MIRYTEKGHGLHDEIRARGHWLKEVDGMWVSSDDAAVQGIIDVYVPVDPLVEAKVQKSAAVSLKAKTLRDKATSLMAAGEMASWPIKRAEAADFDEKGVLAPCPFLRAEAQVRGITLAALVEKVKANATRFQQLEAAIGGVDGKHRDAIAQLATVEAVLAYDFSADWPVV